MGSSQYAILQSSTESPTARTRNHHQHYTKHNKKSVVGNYETITRDELPIQSQILKARQKMQEEKNLAGYGLSAEVISPLKIMDPHLLQNI